MDALIEYIVISSPDSPPMTVTRWYRCMSGMYVLNRLVRVIDDYDSINLFTVDSDMNIDTDV